MNLFTRESSSILSTPKARCSWWRVCFLTAARTLVIVSVCLSIRCASAQEKSNRPAIETLLPETTVALVHITDVPGTIDQLSNGSFATLLDDPSVLPLRERVMEEAYDAYSEFEGTVGLSLNEFTEIPVGEIVFATIAPRRQNLVHLVAIEVGEGNEAAQKALGMVMKNIAAEDESFAEKTELASGIEVDRVQVDGNTVLIAQQKGLIIGCTDEKVLNDFFVRCDGGEVPKVRSLEKNRKFTTVMNRCASRKDLPLDVRFFFDPIRTFQSAARGNLAAQAMIALLPSVGLDGILALGGSVILGDQDYDWVAHGHLLLSKPRSGIVKVMSPEPGEYFPESWVPEDCSLYASTSWDVQQIYEELSKMTDLLGEEGTFDNYIPMELNDDLNFTLEDDILPHFTGRLSYTRVTVDSNKVNGIAHLASFELLEADAFSQTVEEIANQINTNRQKPAVEKREFEGFAYWTRSDEVVASELDSDLFRQERRESMSAPDVAKAQRTRFELRRDIYRKPRPVLGLLGNHLVFCDSIEAFEAAAKTFQGDLPPLSDSEEFTGLSGHLMRLSNMDDACGVCYFNPKIQIQRAIELANAHATKRFLDSMTDRHQLLNRLKGVLDESELPTMEVIQKYIGVQGGFITSADTGYHFLWFHERQSGDQ